MTARPSEGGGLRAAALSTLTIDLNAVRRNYLFLQKKVGRGVDVAAAVKADAYGLGAAPVVRALYEAQCRHFYVATFDEGVAARAALRVDESAHIYALHGPWGARAEDFQAARITPVLNTLDDISYWAEAARAVGKKLPAVVHLDTGINRLGLPGYEVEALIRAARLDLLGVLDIRAVMSHLACADLPDHPKNAAQRALFSALAGQLKVAAPLSLSNSSGIFLGADYHFNQVRPGAAIYGINPCPGRDNPMQPVVTLMARVLEVRCVDRGESVGYAASYETRGPATLATIAAGYADGLARSLADRGLVFLNGQPCPVAGRVSMDAIVVDATGVDVVPGAMAEIIGPHQDVDVLAAEEGTIGYEILTALGKRYQRTYVGRE